MRPRFATVKPQPESEAEAEAASALLEASALTTLTAASALKAVLVSALLEAWALKAVSLASRSFSLSDRCGRQTRSADGPADPSQFSDPGGDRTFRPVSIESNTFLRR